jgi:hypothetical protein
MPMENLPDIIMEPVMISMKHERDIFPVFSQVKSKTKR